MTDTSIDYHSTTIHAEVRHRWPIGAQVASNVRIRIIDRVAFNQHLGYVYEGHFEDNDATWTEPIARADGYWHEVTPANRHYHH